MQCSHNLSCVAPLSLLRVIITIMVNDRVEQHRKSTWSTTWSFCAQSMHVNKIKLGTIFIKCNRRLKSTGWKHRLSTDHSDASEALLKTLTYRSMWPGGQTCHLQLEFSRNSSCRRLWMPILTVSNPSIDLKWWEKTNPNKTRTTKKQEVCWWSSEDKMRAGCCISCVGWCSGWR